MNGRDSLEENEFVSDLADVVEEKLLGDFFLTAGRDAAFGSVVKIWPMSCLSCSESPATDVGPVCPKNMLRIASFLPSVMEATRRSTTSEPEDEVTGSALLLATPAAKDGMLESERFFVFFFLPFDKPVESMK